VPLPLAFLQGALPFELPRDVQQRVGLPEDLEVRTANGLAGVVVADNVADPLEDVRPRADLAQETGHGGMRTDQGP